MEESTPKKAAKPIGIMYMLERLPPTIVMTYPESNVAPIEPMAAAMFMYEVVTPLFDFGVSRPIREAQAGATIDAANA